MPYTNKTTKTQKKLERALLTLMKEKKFESITINDITDLADVNRSTFYRHYLDKYELLEKIENSILDEITIFYLKSTPHKLNIDFEISDYITSTNNFFTIFEKHLHELSILISSNGSPTFRENLSKTLRASFEKTFSKITINITTTQKELLFNFLSGALISNLEYWTDHQELTAEELFSFSINITSNGVVKFIKENMK